MCHKPTSFKSGILRTLATPEEIALVAGRATRAADQDGCVACASWPLRRLPDGRCSLLSHPTPQARSIQREPREKIVWRAHFSGCILVKGESNAECWMKRVLARRWAPRNPWRSNFAKTVTGPES